MTRHPLDEFQVQTMHEGSIIDVKVDFDTQRIHFWHNDKYQGYSECVFNSFKEGKIFPAASFRYFYKRRYYLQLFLVQRQTLCFVMI